MMKRKYSALLAVAGAAVMLGGCNISRPYSLALRSETAGLYRDTVSVTDTLSGRYGRLREQADAEAGGVRRSEAAVADRTGVVQQYRLVVGSAGGAGISGAADCGSFGLRSFVYAGAERRAVAWVEHGSLQKTYTLPLSARLGKSICSANCSIRSGEPRPHGFRARRR